MFKVYKPKGDRVRAVQVTNETIKEIVNVFHGRVVTTAVIDPETNERTVAGFEYPTFDGPRQVSMSHWIIADANAHIEKTMSDDEFQAMYEPARVTRGEQQ